MSSGRPLAASIVAATVVVVCSLLPAVPGAAATSSRQTRSVTTREIAPGITYRKIVNKRIPRIVHLLTVDPTQGATVGVGLPKPQLPGLAPTSDIAAKATAATNGDFGLLPGRPAHLFAENGELIQTTILGAGEGGIGLQVSFDQHYAIGPATPTITLDDAGALQTIARWNHGAPTAGKVVGFTPAGGTLEQPPSDSCSARLLSTGPEVPSVAGVTTPYVVDATRCGQSPMTLNGGVVLAARLNGRGAAFIQTLPVGDNVTVTWSLPLPGTVTAIGGGPQLVRNGAMAVKAGCLGYLCLKQPRTGVGVTADGKLVIVVVEGRYGGSTGVNLAQFARIFLHRDCVDALNLDGGGSSTMVIGGKIVNYLSDGFERSVSSSLEVHAP